MVGQRLGRWRCKVGYSEAGAAARRGRLPWVAATGSSLRPRPRGCLDAGNGRRFQLPGFPLSWGCAHPREEVAAWGSRFPLFMRSFLRLPPPRSAFPWSSFPFWLLGAEPGAVSGRAPPGSPNPVSFLVISRDVKERGTNF